MYESQRDDTDEQVLHGTFPCQLLKRRRADTKISLSPPVLDLPQLYTRPRASDLLSTLDQLSIKPASWDTINRQHLVKGEEKQIQINEDGVPKYLTGIISSSLLWIGDESVREEIWEVTSARLAERSGRSAQPTLTRTFKIPNLSPDASPIQIQLREPSLTADNLGHKTWLASYLLARRLPSLNHLLPPFKDLPSTYSPQILELGSGTGLLGIAAAALYPDATIHLTDLEAIVPNLEANVKANEALFSESSCPSVGVLDWSATYPGKLNRRYNLILASDPLYSPSHPAWLAKTIHKYLDSHPMSRVVVELPLREAYVPEVEEFKERMAGIDLVLLDSGEELGTEDWGDDTGHGREEVRCWWGVWGWSLA